MSWERPSVLIVDDEPDVCDLLSEELSEGGFVCCTALDGEAAISLASAQPFEVVLLDLRLPRVSGMDVLRRLRSTGCSAAVIVMTAVNEAETAVEAMKLGALDYVVKPFSPRTIRSIINALPTRRRSSAVRNWPAIDSSASPMDAIAGGVNARYERLDGPRRGAYVVERTVAVAQRLGLPMDDIRQWETSRAPVFVECAAISGDWDISRAGRD